MILWTRAAIWGKKRFKKKKWQMREDLPVCIQMKAGITPGLTVNTRSPTFCLCTGAKPLASRSLAGSMREFRLRPTDYRLQRHTKKTENGPEHDGKLTAPSMQRWFVLLSCWSLIDNGPSLLSQTQLGTSTGLFTLVKHVLLPVWTTA